MKIATTLIILMLTTACGKQDDKADKGPAGGPPPQQPPATADAAPTAKAAAPADAAAPATPAPDPAALAGIWLDGPEAKPGEGGQWNLAGDGTYVFAANQSNCEENLGSEGTWRVEGDTLVVDEKEREAWVGGTVQVKDEACERVGGKKQKVTEASTRRIPLADCPAEIDVSGDGEMRKTDSFGRACKRFDNQMWWRDAGKDSK